MHEKSGDITRALKVLEEAREVLGSSDVGLAAKVCLQMAEYSSMLRDYDTAINHYKRSIIYQPDDTHTQIALARLYMQVMPSKLTFKPSHSENKKVCYYGNRGVWHKNKILGNTIFHM